MDLRKTQKEKRLWLNKIIWQITAGVFRKRLLLYSVQKHFEVQVGPLQGGPPPSGCLHLPTHHPSAVGDGRTDSDNDKKGFELTLHCLHNHLNLCVKSTVGINLCMLVLYVCYPY